MTIVLRRGAPRDGAAAGDICYRAFKTVAEAHNFKPDFPSPDVAAGFHTALIRHEGFFDLVAETDGRIVGSGFLDERNPIAGLGPITIDPAMRNDGAGRALMEAPMRRAQERGFAGTRLVQAGYHSRLLALYLKLGFEAREHPSCLQGPAIGKAVPDFWCPPAMES